jgi:hypothetical protein
LRFERVLPCSLVQKAVLENWEYIYGVPWEWIPMENYPEIHSLNSGPFSLGKTKMI